MVYLAKTITLLYGIHFLSLGGVFFMLLEDIMQEFEFHLQTKNYSPRTIRGYRNNNKRFIAFLLANNVVKLHQINPKHIKSYINQLITLGRKASYCNGILKCIRAFFNYCLEEEYINTNPCDKVNWVKEPKCIISTFNDKEIRSMLTVYQGHTFMDIRNKLIIALLVDTGIRNLELCNINTVDVRDRVIHIQGKGNKERVVPISPMLKKLIIKYDRVRSIYIKDKLVTTDSYLLSQTGSRLTIEAIERVVRKCGDKAKVRNNIRCSPHTIRHYYAQAMLRGGLDVYSLSRLLGHEDISITKRYLQGIKDNTIIELANNTSPLMKLTK